MSMQYIYIYIYIYYEYIYIYIYIYTNIYISIYRVIYLTQSDVADSQIDRNSIQKECLFLEIIAVTKF